MSTFIFARFTAHLIPFKREGLSEQYLGRRKYQENLSKFQFPSNGKVFPNSISIKFNNYYNLSFQFPSNGKVFPNLYGFPEQTFEVKFQFPSNGKVFPNNGEFLRESHSTRVSIPFKREGLSEQYEQRRSVGAV